MINLYLTNFFKEFSLKLVESNKTKNKPENHVLSHIKSCNFCFCVVSTQLFVG